jgi:1-acyl-sn-glycerol-3-phosphate acyltransferase
MSFVLFGLGGLVLGALVFPTMFLVFRDGRRRARVARRIIQMSFRAFIGFMRLAGVLTWRLAGAERLQRSGLLVLANHPTLLDVVFLCAVVPNANCVVKAALLRNPVMRGPVRAAGFICNDEGPGLITDCIASLEAGDNLVLFPEGTRTPPDVELGAFQRGAANIAVRGRRRVTPVLIRCEPPTLKKGQKWYAVPLRRMHFTIDVLTDVDLALRETVAADAVAAREHSRRLRDHFVEELRRAGAGTGNQAAHHFGTES